jgi:methionyl-tRNA formyltransferase
LNLRATAHQIICQIRAYNFREFQIPRIFDRPITGWKISNNRSSSPPGTLISESERGITISTVDYDVQLFVDEFDELISAIHAEDLPEIALIVSRQPHLLLETTKEGWTPFMIAAFHGKFETCRMFLDLGVDPNQRSNKGTSLLMYAKANALLTKDLRICEMLIKRGADVDAKDMHNKTVRDYLILETKGNDQLLRLIDGKDLA